MGNTQKTSFSLLNQTEIDALVDFLNDKRDSIDSDIMNQSSIDKLISLIKTDSKHIILDRFDPFENVNTDLSSSLGIRESEDEDCELCFSIDDETNFVVLTARNSVTGKEVKLTPKLLNENDIDEWGYSISPLFFNIVARTFSLKYTAETHDKVCNAFARHNYGSESHKISEMYLPPNSDLFSSMQ